MTTADENLEHYLPNNKAPIEKRQEFMKTREIGTAETPEGFVRDCLVQLLHGSLH
jgi:hypothetical protein